MSLVDTVDALQDAATREGLIEIFGQDEIQRVFAEVFAGVRSAVEHATKEC